MRLKEIILAACLTSCAGVPKTTRTPGPDGIIGNLPETVCPENYAQHVEKIGAIERVAFRACLKNDIPDIKAHCEKVYSGNNGSWHLYGGEPFPSMQEEFYVWSCSGMAVQSVRSGVYGAEVKNSVVGVLLDNGVRAATIPSGVKAQEVEQTPSSPQDPLPQTPPSPTR